MVVSGLRERRRQKVVGGHYEKARIDEHLWNKTISSDKRQTINSYLGLKIIANGHKATNKNRIHKEKCS